MRSYKIGILYILIKNKNEKIRKTKSKKKLLQNQELFHFCKKRKKKFPKLVQEPINLFKPETIKKNICKLDKEKWSKKT